MPDVLQKLSRLTGYRKLAQAALPFLPRPLQKGLRRFHFRRAIRHSLDGPVPPVVVYTAHKVASTAVTHALQSVGGADRLPHPHDVGGQHAAAR